MAQYRELATFAQFGTADLDKATRAQLELGQRVTEVLKQNQYNPMSLSKEVTILYAVNKGFLDDVPVEKIAEFESNFHKFMESNHPEIFKQIETDKEFKPETEDKLKSAISEFKQSIGISKEADD